MNKSYLFASPPGAAAPAQAEDAEDGGHVLPRRDGHGGLAGARVDVLPRISSDRSRYITCYGALDYMCLRSRAMTMRPHSTHTTHWFTLIDFESRHFMLVVVNLAYVNVCLLHARLDS